MKDKPARPTHVVKVYNRKTKDRGIVGQAWANSDGSTTIKLYPCVTLINDPDIAITLFPNKAANDD